jgi:Predicted membrane protein (DUF2157)
VAEEWTRLLARWTAAGVLDDEAAARIRAYELEHAGSNRLRWPIRIALVFGALTLGAGVLLFVSAHWDSLSPQARFALVTLLVAVFHIGGATTEERFPGMAMTLHALGTIALGAGIFLAGQIFNLDEHWPGGLMLWALGAALAWALLKASPQLALVAILGPAWLAGEWFVAIEGPYYYFPRHHIETCGLFLLALAYLTVARPEDSLERRTLSWLGGVALLPTALALVFFAADTRDGAQALPVRLQVVGWALALGVPLIVAVLLRRAAAWPNALAMVWVLVLITIRPALPEIFLYVWWGVGATAFAWWGVSERRGERINIGAVVFAATVLTFYFSEVMDKLGRSSCSTSPASWTGWGAPPAWSGWGCCFWREAGRLNRFVAASSCRHEEVWRDEQNDAQRAVGGGAARGDRVESGSQAAGGPRDASARVGTRRSGRPQPSDSGPVCQPQARGRPGTGRQPRSVAADSNRPFGAGWPTRRNA